MQELLNRVNNCINFVNTTSTVLENITVQEEDLKAKNKTLASFVEDLDTAIIYYKKSVDIIYQRTIRKLESQLSELLQEVFSGCNYGIQFTIEDLRGTKNLIIEFINDNYERDPDDVGGSLQTVVGYLFHLMYLIKSGKPKILLMDELFRDVHNDCLMNLIELINRLTKATDSINVLITHVEELECIAEKIYVVNRGDYEVYSSKV